MIEPEIRTDRWHLVQRTAAVLKRQGAGAVFKKAGRRVFRAVGKRYQAWWLGRLPWLPDERPVFLQVCHAGGAAFRSM